MAAIVHVHVSMYVHRMESQQREEKTATSELLSRIETQEQQVRQHVFDCWVCCYVFNEKKTLLIVINGTPRMAQLKRTSQ